MYCPKCACEYREEFNQCSDCKVNLVEGSPPSPDTEYVKPVVIFTTSNIHEAHLVMSFLQGSGIEVLNFDSHLASLNPFLTNAIGGIRLAVDENNVSRAKELLKEYSGGKGGNNSPWK